MFRVNFLTFWVVANGAYAILITMFANKSNSREINTGHVSGFLDVFSTYLAALMIYKFIFGLIHILKFKCRNSCGSKYKIRRINLMKEVRRIKKLENDSGMDLFFDGTEQSEDEND